MKKSVQKITLLILVLLQFQTVFSQYKSTEKISNLFVESNKKTLRDFLSQQNGKTKILVLPFLTNTQKPGVYSDDIARKISSALQREFQNKNNIMIFVKDEFDGDNVKILESYSTAGTKNKYYDNLLAKYCPDFALDGKYSITVNAAGQEILKIEQINIKNYYYKTSDEIKKTALKSCKTSIPSTDKTVNIKTTHFVWASGKAIYYEKAEEKSLENLLSKIAASLQTKFLSVKPSDMSIGEYSQKVINTYQYLIADKIQSKVVSEEEGNCEIIKYISKDILSQIFEEREIAIKNYLQLGNNAEKDLRIADALLNYYRALVLIKTHPEYSKMQYDLGKGNVKLSSALPEKIRNILRNTKYSIKSKDKVSPQVTNYTIDIKYMGKAVQNAEYKFWHGNGYSNHVRAKNGTGVVELAGAGSENAKDLKFKTEYMFASKSREDLAFAAALDIAAPPRFSETTQKISTSGSNSKSVASTENYTPQKTVDTGKSLQKTSQSRKGGSTKSINTNTGNLNSKTAGDILNQITKAIKNRQYSSVKNYFSKEGYEMFTKLINYGNARVLNTQGNYKLVKMNSRNVYRSIPMKFTFGKKIIIENVNFVFNGENKISAISFALTDKAVDDIMRSPWPEYDKYELLSFMENYKTAYQLKRLGYINSIFSDDALIIIGHVLKNSPIKDNELRKIKYDKKTKKEYLASLKRSFAANDYINLRFEESGVMKGKLDHVYGIQLNQIYTSSNYADKGYLFLLIDLRNPENPLIHVRTWQPEKNPDGSIYGVDDFYFD